MPKKPQIEIWERTRIVGYLDIWKNPHIRSILSTNKERDDRIAKVTYIKQVAAELPKGTETKSATSCGNVSVTRIVRDRGKMTVYEALNLVVQTNLLLITAVTLLVTIIVHLNKKK